MKYFDKNINDIEHALMKQHLKACEKCNAEFEELNGIFNLLLNDNQIEPPLNFESDVMKKVEEVDFARKKRNDRFLIMLYSMISLSIALVSLFIIQNFNSFTFIETIKNAVEQLSAFSSALFIIYEVTGRLTRAFVQIMGNFFQASLALIKTYNYVFTILLGILLILETMYRKMVRQDNGGVG
jgi:predicted anti-sigma-YlaC factor YlaD